MVNPVIKLLHLLSPKRCVACGKFGSYFCIDCLKKIKPFFHQRCIVCSRVSHGGATHNACRRRRSLDGLFCLFKYQGIVRNGIIKLKYSKLTDIEEELADLISANLQLQGEYETLGELEDFILTKQPVVTPIPLHWWKQTKRGFNQAEIIGNIVADSYDLPILPMVLKRKFRLKSQTKLKIKQRAKNAKGVYFVNENYLEKGKIDPMLNNILLVDDVTTTGSTLKEAAKVLKQMGAKYVWGIAFAT